MIRLTRLDNIDFIRKLDTRLVRKLGQDWAWFCHNQSRQDQTRLDKAGLDLTDKTWTRLDFIRQE